MAISSFKDLLVWQKAMELVKAIYGATVHMPREEKYGLSDQMRRAAVSIPSNIAEGQYRKHIGEYVQFVRIAYGSTAELETQLLLAKDLYRDVDFSRAQSLLTEIQKMLNVLIRRLDSKHS